MRPFILATTFSALVATGAMAAQTQGQQTPPTRPPAGQTPPPLPVPPTTQKPAVPPATPPVPFPADAKIGFVNIQVLVSQSKLGQEGTKRMQELQGKQQADMAAKSKAIQTLQQQIQQGTSVLTAQVLQGKQSELEKAQREAQFAQQDNQAEQDALNQQLMTNFQDKLLPVLEGVRKAHNLWVIFSVADSGAGAIEPGLDLSMEVVKALDAATAKTGPGGGSLLPPA